MGADLGRPTAEIRDTGVNILYRSTLLTVLCDCVSQSISTLRSQRTRRTRRGAHTMIPARLYGFRPSSIEIVIVFSWLASEVRALFLGLAPMHMLR